MKNFDNHWQKLTALARQAPAVSPWAPFERFALRGLLVAAAFGVGSIAFNYANLQADPADEYAATDTVGELLDVS